MRVHGLGFLTFSTLRLLPVCTAVALSSLLAGRNPTPVAAQAFASDRLSISPTLGSTQTVGNFSTYFDPKLGGGLRLSYALNADAALVVNGRLDMFGGAWLYDRHPTFQNRAPDLRAALIGVGIERLVVEPDADGVSVRLGGGVGLVALSSDDFQPLPVEPAYRLSQVRPALSATLLLGYSFGRFTVFGDTGYFWAPLREDDFIRALRVGPKLYILESIKAVPLGLGIRTRL